MLLLALLLLTLRAAAQSFTVPPIPLAFPTAVGGALTTQNGAIGFASSSSSATSASAASTGGLVNTVTLVSSGNGAGDADEIPATLPSVGRYVPDYRANAEATAKSESASPAKRKVKVRRYPTPAPASRPEVCWTISKKCCYEAVQNGYKCKDYYVYKYARCHPVIEYKQICGEITEQPKEHPKPDGRVLFEESIIKNYDSRYGPHVEGYPDGESQFYDTPVIPQRPHGVTAEPFDPPQTGGNAHTGSWNQDSRSKTYEEGHQGAGWYNNEKVGGNANDSGGGRYAAQPPPSTTAPATVPTQQYTPTSQVNNAIADSGPGGGTAYKKTAYTGNAPTGSNPSIVAADTPVQASGTYRLVEPTEEAMR